MVFLLWVTIRNWVIDEKSFSRFMNRPTLASSSGASTSSRRQKGLGLV